MNLDRRLFYPIYGLYAMLGINLDLCKQRLNALGLYLNAPEPAVICCHCEFVLKASVNSIAKHVAEFLFDIEQSDSTIP